MPKKTRREKLLAQKRRLSSPVIVSPFQFHVTPQKKTLALEADNTVELIAIKSDLVKTLVLALLAITLELIVYRLLNSK